MNFPNRTIKEGDLDRVTVVALQNRINELGLGPLQATGTYGLKTKSAIKLFQSTHRDQNGNPLEIDGKVGAITWAALFGIEEVNTVNDAGSLLLKKVVEVAQSQLGVMEKPPGSNKGPEVNQYLDSVGCPPGLFWCASFVYWCFRKASQELNRANPAVQTGGCLNHWNKSKGEKITAAQAAADPALIKPGQIFILDHGSGMGHTGLIEKVEGGFISTIEGNSNVAGSRNGIGVFRLQRKIIKINKGFIEYK